MKKKHFIFLAILFLVPTMLFFLPRAVSAQSSSPEATVDLSTRPVRQNGDISMTVPVTVNAAARALGAVFIGYQQITSANVGQVNSWTLTPGIFSSNLAKKCTAVLDSSGNLTNNLTCTIPHLSYGVYYFEIYHIGALSSTQLSGLFSFSVGDPDGITTSPDQASGDTGENVDALTATVTGTSVSVSGNFNTSAQNEIVNGGGFNELQVEYGNLTALSANPKIASVDSWQTMPATPVVTNGSTVSFTATASGLAPGTYIYAVEFNDGGKSTPVMFSSFASFTIAALPTPQLVLPIVVTPSDSTGNAQNTTVDITINVPGATAGDNNEFIQIGSASQGACMAIPSLLSPKLLVSYSTPLHIEYSFGPQNTPAYNFAPGVYCVGVSTDSGKTFTYFSDKADLFSTGGQSIPANLNITKGANPNGCVTGNGNNGYCLLVPLPGIGDATGYVNVSGTDANGQSGLGNYINGIIRLVIGLIGVLSVLMIVIGGVEYMTTVNMGEKEGARSRIMGAIYGLILALASYMLLYTINPDLVNLTVTVPSVQLTLNEDSGVESDETGSTPTAPAGTGITVPTGSAQALAQQILQNSSITLDGVWGQNDATSTPMQNITDTANGVAASTSKAASSQLGGVRQTPLSAKMLAGMIAVAEVSPITITAIEGSVHSGPGSAHYSGRAFDIQASDSASSLPLYKKLGDACAVAGASLVITPCGGNYSSSTCAATGYSTNTGHKTHIHCQWSS